MTKIRCGAARRCVTPPLGLNIPSCMVFKGATGVKDELYTHALAVESDGKTAILISVDNAGLGTRFTRDVRRALHEKIGVEPDAVMVSAIHIHTGGPQLMDAFWGQGFDREVYALNLQKTVEAAVEAYENRVPVTLRYGQGEERGIAFCRNYVLADGSIKTNPGRKIVHEIVRPVSEIDATVGVLRMEDATGKPVAMVVNFACHPDTVGGTEYCADYPGVMRRLLRERYGEDMTVLFFNGCSGNINHLDAKKFADPDFRYPKDHYQTMGKILADDVTEIHGRMTDAGGDGQVCYARRCFRAPRHVMTEEEIAWAYETVDNPEARGVDRAFARERIRLHKHPKRYENIELQAIRVGDCAFIGFPGEPYSDMGLALRKASPFRNLIISELAGNELGYFATEPSYSGGVYEAKFPSACIEPPVIDRMMVEAEALLKRLAK